MSIAVSMTNPTGVTLHTGGKYCPQHIQVTPDFVYAPQMKRWQVQVDTHQIPENATDYILVEQDEFLQENRNRETLCVMILADTPIDPTASGKALIMAWTTNTIRTNLKENSRGSFLSVNASGNIGSYFKTTSLTQNWEGHSLYIDQQGNLSVRLLSSDILLAGTYTVLAWLS